MFWGARSVSDKDDGLTGRFARSESALWAVFTASFCVTVFTGDDCASESAELTACAGSDEGVDVEPAPHETKHGSKSVTAR